MLAHLKIWIFLFGETPKKTDFFLLLPLAPHIGGAVGANGKTAQKWPKSTKFLNWLKTHPKVENAENQRQFHNFGGYWTYKSGPKIFVWAPKVAIFWGHFCQKCPSLRVDNFQEWVRGTKLEENQAMLERLNFWKFSTRQS